VGIENEHGGMGSSNSKQREGPSNDNEIEVEPEQVEDITNEEEGEMEDPKAMGVPLHDESVAPEAIGNITGTKTVVDDCDVDVDVEIVDRATKRHFPDVKANETKDDVVVPEKSQSKDSIAMIVQDDDTPSREGNCSKNSFLHVDDSNKAVDEDVVAEDTFSPDNSVTTLSIPPSIEKPSTCAANQMPPRTYNEPGLPQSVLYVPNMISSLEKSSLSTNDQIPFPPDMEPVLSQPQPFSSIAIVPSSPSFRENLKSSPSDNVHEIPPQTLSATTTTPSERKPKRPLSGYNLFFKVERDRIFSGKNDSSRKYTPEEVAYAAAILKGTIVATKPNKKDDSVMLGYGDLARRIGLRWKVLNSQDRSIFESFADQERLKYHALLKKWKKRQSSIPTPRRTDAVTSSVDIRNPSDNYDEPSTSQCRVSGSDMPDNQLNDNNKRPCQPSFYEMLLMEQRRRSMTNRRVSDSTGMCVANKKERSSLDLSTKSHLKRRRLPLTINPTKPYIQSSDSGSSTCSENDSISDKPPLTAQQREEIILLLQNRMKSQAQLASQQSSVCFPSHPDLENDQV
jgi:hypothetical protein